MSDKRITSDEMYFRLKQLIPNMPDEVISMDLQLRPGLFTVMQLRMEVTDDAGNPKLMEGSTREIETVDKTLAVYNANDLDELISNNEKMKDILARILLLHDMSEVDYQAMREGKELLDRMGVYDNAK